MKILALEPGEKLIPGPDFLQSDFWASFKCGFGWKARRFRLEMSTGGPGAESMGLLVLERRLPLGISFAYVPHGPYMDVLGAPGTHETLCLEYAQNPDTSDWGGEPQNALSGKLADIASELKKILPPACAFIRFDLPQYRLGSQPQSLALPFRKSCVDVQPPDTVYVDLRPREDEILSAMKPKWRYNVKLAEKKGVSVEAVDATVAGVPELDAALDEFYDLYRETSERDKIALHGKGYYRALFSAAQADPGAPRVRLYFARSAGKVLAAIVTLFGREEAVYLYGASSNESRNLMPAYALQWRAMRDAKSAGCSGYDLFGVPPSDDPSHPMHGLYRFKTGFGGLVLHRLGCHDYPLRKGAYALFSLAERARAFWFKRVAKIGKKREGTAGREESPQASPKTEASKE
jgi:lipid II:glycine glycyltransferase (peptidoglycan interpeptide bridge formation enzyme)